MALLKFLEARDLSPLLETRETEEVTDIGVAFELAMSTAGGSSLPALYRGKTLIADMVASSHLKVLDEATRTFDPEIPALLKRPDPNLSLHDFLHQIAISLIVHGNAYLWANSFDSQGYPKSLYVIDPREVQVFWNNNQTYPLYSWRDRGLKRGHDLWHIALNKGPGDLIGTGPITAARMSIEGMTAAEKLAKNLYVDDGTPSGVLKAKRDLTDAQLTKLQTNWADNHGSGRKKLAVLNPWLDFQPLTWSPVDLQFIESRRYNDEQIAKLLGIPPGLLGVSSGDSLTYSTTESIFRMLVISTLRPQYFERIEHAFTEMLPPGKAARFDYSELIEADYQTQVNALREAVDGGFMTPNEARQALGLEPVADGDALRPSQGVRLETK